MRHRPFSALIGLLLALAPAQLARAAETVEYKGLSANQMFAVAEQSTTAGDIETATTIYAALAKDPDIEIRTEARFRHGNLLVAQRKLADAAVLFRTILDEKPDAQRVRLELAAVLLQLGEERQALRALR